MCAWTDSCTHCSCPRPLGAPAKVAKPTLLFVMSPVSSAPELRRIQRMEFPVDGLMLTPTLHWESYFENEQHRHMKLLKQRPVKAPWGKECVKSLRSQPAHSQIYLNEDSRLGSTKTRQACHCNYYIHAIAQFIGKNKCIK